MHFNKKKVSGLNLLMATYLFYCEVKTFCRNNDALSVWLRLVLLYMCIHNNVACNTLPLPIKESQRLCICLLGISILYLSIGFWNCSDNVVFVVFHFIINYTTKINQLNVQNNCLLIMNLYIYIYH